MLTSKIKLISATVIGAFLLVLTVNAAAISNQALSQDIPNLAVLALGILSLALGRHFSQQRSG